MVFGKIHGGEYVPVVFHFRSIGDIESHTGKYIDDFVLTMESGWRVPNSIG